MTPFTFQLIKSLQLNVRNPVWKVISVKSLLYVINVVIKKNAVSIKKNAVFCKRSLKYPAQSRPNISLSISLCTDLITSRDMYGFIKTRTSLLPSGL